MTLQKANITLGVGLRAKIIAVLSANPGGLTTAELCAYLPDAPPKKITHLAIKLRERLLLKSQQELITTRGGARRVCARWFITDKPKPSRTNFVTRPEKTDGPGVCVGHQAWMGYWKLPRAERRKIPPPDYFPVPHRADSAGHYRMHES